VDGVPVLLVRDGDAVYALAGTALMPAQLSFRARAMADWSAHGIRCCFVFRPVRCRTVRALHHLFRAPQPGGVLPSYSRCDAPRVSGQVARLAAASPAAYAMDRRRGCDSRQPPKHSMARR
jgi:hypothetical protein